MLPRPQCFPGATAPKTALDDYYLTKGYYPALQKGEAEPMPRTSFEKRQAVAVTLAGSYDDWAVGEMAKELEKKTTGKHSMHAPSIIKMYGIPERHVPAQR